MCEPEANHKGWSQSLELGRQRAMSLLFIERNAIHCRKLSHCMSTSESKDSSDTGPRHLMTWETGVKAQQILDTDATGVQKGIS